MQLVRVKLTETVVSHDKIGVSMIQCAVQPGLAHAHSNVTLCSEVKKIRKKKFRALQNNAILPQDLMVYCE